MVILTIQTELRKPLTKILVGGGQQDFPTCGYGLGVQRNFPLHSPSRQTSRRLLTPLNLPHALGLPMPRTSIMPLSRLLMKRMSSVTSLTVISSVSAYISVSSANMTRKPLTYSTPYMSWLIQMRILVS